MCYNFFYDRELLNQSTKKKVISHLFIKVKKKITSASKRRKEVASEIIKDKSWQWRTASQLT
jgi:hypothetical protein